MSKWTPMAYEEALDMIDHVEYAYNSPNFVRGSYTACRWFDAVKTALEIAKRVEKHWNEIKDDNYCTGIENCDLCEMYEDGFRDAIAYAVRGENNG